MSMSEINRLMKEAEKALVQAGQYAYRDNSLSENYSRIAAVYATLAKVELDKDS